jgi:HAMP domain-containing protein
VNTLASPLRSGIQGRLLLILGLATLAILAASAMALVALMEIRVRVAEVTNRELPASSAALVLARVGERLQDRTPALMAAKGADARQHQTNLINRDLRSLASETERLRDLHPGGSGGVADITRLAPALANNLRDLALLLERQADLGTALQRQRAQVIALREDVAQVLGPSILAVAAVLARAPAPDPGLFRRAAVAQGPLLDAERLVGSALGEQLIAAQAPTTEQVALARNAYERTLDQLSGLIPAIPAGLRTGLQGALTRLAGQLGPDGIFALRHHELTTLDDADRLVAASRAIATDLKQRVDALVRSANENIARAADAMGANLLNNTLWFVAVSVAVVLLATLLSYRFVVRDISLNLRAVTRAMQRLAAGERDARVPAQERHDEIGDLARVFNWRRA